MRAFVAIDVLEQTREPIGDAAGWIAEDLPVVDEGKRLLVAERAARRYGNLATRRGQDRHHLFDARLIRRVVERTVARRGHQEMLCRLRCWRKLVGDDSHEFRYAANDSVVFLGDD